MNNFLNYFFSFGSKTRKNRVAPSQHSSIHESSITSNDNPLKLKGHRSSSSSSSASDRQQFVEVLKVKEGSRKRGRLSSVVGVDDTPEQYSDSKKMKPSALGIKKRRSQKRSRKNRKHKK